MKPMQPIHSNIPDYDFGPHKTPYDFGPHKTPSPKSPKAKLLIPTGVKILAGLASFTGVLALFTPHIHFLPPNAYFVCQQSNGTLEVQNISGWHLRMFCDPVFYPRSSIIQNPIHVIMSDGSPLVVTTTLKFAFPQNREQRKELHRRFHGPDDVDRTVWLAAINAVKMASVEVADTTAKDLLEYGEKRAAFFDQIVDNLKGTLTRHTAEINLLHLSAVLTGMNEKDKIITRALNSKEGRKALAESIVEAQRKEQE